MHLARATVQVIDVLVQLGLAPRHQLLLLVDECLGLTLNALMLVSEPLDSLTFANERLLHLDDACLLRVVLCTMQGVISAMRAVRASSAAAAVPSVSFSDCSWALATLSCSSAKAFAWSEKFLVTSWYRLPNSARIQVVASSGWAIGCASIWKLRDRALRVIKTNFKIACINFYVFAVETRVCITALKAPLESHR